METPKEYVKTCFRKYNQKNLREFVSGSYSFPQHCMSYRLSVGAGLFTNPFFLNPLKRCLKGVIRCAGWTRALRGGGGFVLVSQGVANTNIWEIEENLFFFPFFWSNPFPIFCWSGVALSTDASVMEETMQSLRQELRTMYPKRWSTENVLHGWQGGDLLSALQVGHFDDILTYKTWHTEYVTEM